MATKGKRTWGGRRKGAGRRPGSGRPKEEVRRNRLMISLTDAELRKLEGLADRRSLPPALVAYEFVARGLKRLE